jgi:exportin-5
MDPTQRDAILQAIAISASSSPQLIPLITPQSRATAFQTLEQFKSFPGKIPACLEWLSTERHILSVAGITVDITSVVKLYSMTLLQGFLKQEYAKVNNDDRIALRNAILATARHLISNPEEQGETRFLANKIATLLADVAVRDFPQRWTTFSTDVFSPVGQGGLWTSGENETGAGGIGTKICLECLRILVEDCTDGDFNSRISTPRRNDVLIGLNEVHSHLLPPMFHLLSNQYAILTNAQQTLTQMHQYLHANQLTVSQLGPSESEMYSVQHMAQTQAGKILHDILLTLEKFCQSMPTDWILRPANDCDFVSALLHLLRVDTCDLNQVAADCLYQLAHRKLDVRDWTKLMTALPQAIGEAEEALTSWDAGVAAAQGRVDLQGVQRMVKHLKYHIRVSKGLSMLVSGHVANITTNKGMLEQRNSAAFVMVVGVLNLLADMLTHPCARICGEQINMWTLLLRDPVLTKASSRLLKSFLERVLVALIKNLVKVRWDDVENQDHPLSELMEETWEDKADYESWLCEFRSKAYQTMRLISNTEPKLAVTVTHQRFGELFTQFANGGGRDHLDPTTQQLTQQSTASLEFEGFVQPLDTILRGLPQWALDTSKRSDPSYMDPHRVEIRNEIRTMMSSIANQIVGWNPTDTWLKFRRVQLLDSLKFYWEHDPSTLVTGIGVFLAYLGEENPSFFIYNSNASVPRKLHDDIVSLRKKSGVSLISVSKKIPHLLAPYLGQLSERVKALLSMQTILPTNQNHLYEFLSCVATAVEDPVARSNFITDVLTNALNTLESQDIKAAISSPEGLLSFLGVVQAGHDQGSVTNNENVSEVKSNYGRLFSSLNQLLSVGKRCHDAARKRPNEGIPLSDDQLLASASNNLQNFPDEGAVGLNDLTVNDPFVHLWPKILPPLLQLLDSICTLWHPEYQAKLLRNTTQRFIYAVTDDEAYLAKNQTNQSNGGVFGEGGTAGSVLHGWDRRGENLAAKWGAWFNEIRNACYQLLGLISAQRVLFAPEFSSYYQSFVNVVAKPTHIQSMEHRHMTLYIKQFIEYILVCCPSSLYQSHAAPIVAPFFENMHIRLQCSWSPIKEGTANGSNQDPTKPITSSDCEKAADLAMRGGNDWKFRCYASGGIFVGDCDAVTSEALVEKYRVDITRAFSDMLQVVLALKGTWALVLANIAKEEQALKKKDTSKLAMGPKTKLITGEMVNADGSRRGKFHEAIEARKLLRIKSLCHFLLLENEAIAGYLVLAVTDCLSYPDTYTCRRVTKICHRILETVAWYDHYTQLLGKQMFTAAVTAVVTEPKWMVGIEWETVNLIRDIYCRLVLGQGLLCGGQGPAMQQLMDSTNTRFEQSKVADSPLQGGGVLCVPSDIPREILASLPGINANMVIELEKMLKRKRAAKDQKDALKDLLRLAADTLKQSEGGNGRGNLLGRADKSESLLHQKERDKDVVPQLPEKLVTHSMQAKQNADKNVKLAGEMENKNALGALFGV